MNTHENIHRFLERWGLPAEDAGPFNVYRIGDMLPDDRSPFGRRGYYKISLLLEGESSLIYADHTIPVKTPAIVFSNPLIPYRWERHTEKQDGYFCLFTEKFVTHELKTTSPAESPLFRVQGHHVLFPDEPATERIITIYEQMLNEAAGHYNHKDDVLRNHIQLLIHEALKITPPAEAFARTTSTERITQLFLELLARQFPVTTVHDTIRLKTAAAFASQLSIHVNYLNRAVKTVTGKTTTQWISEHLAMEAQYLLRHTHWDMAEIGYCLGFGHASNFTTFFRRMTGKSPQQFRETKT